MSAKPEYVAEVVTHLVIKERIPDRRFKSGYRSKKNIAMGVMAGMLLLTDHGIVKIDSECQVSIGEPRTQSVMVST